MTTEQELAYQLFGEAIRIGFLVRPKQCEDCGIECTPDGHHHDYGKPLEVRWLCRKCHAAITAKAQKGKPIKRTVYTGRPGIDRVWLDDKLVYESPDYKPPEIVNVSILSEIW